MTEAADTKRTLTRSDSTRAELPAWAQRIRRTYLRGESSLFLLHGNVFDRVPHGDGLCEVSEFLCRTLLDAHKATIVLYDPSSRVSVRKKGPDAAALASVTGKRSAGEVLPALEELLQTASSTAIVIPYVDMLAPAGEMNFLSEQDRINVVSLHRWSLDVRLSTRDNVVFVLAEQLSSVHPMLVANPRVTPIEIPLPDLATRVATCRLANPELNEREANELGAHTAGLKAVQIHGLLSPSDDDLDHAERLLLITRLLGQSPDAPARAHKLAQITRSMTEEQIRHLISPESKTDGPARAVLDDLLPLVFARKREILEKECFELIEFITPRHDLSAVGGMEEIKRELRKLAQAIRAGERARVPMGLLLVGAMGTGKTFVANAFAKESGIVALKLKNFRSKWVGATESNLEKVLSIVRALGPVLLVIDEGERSFGDAGDSDGGTSSRVIARIKEFMGDPDNRGRVVFMLMTNRPDKLDVDIKRAGRLDRKIPFFYAGTASDVEAILLAQLARHAVAHKLEFPRDRELISARLVDYSNADLEAVVLLAHELAHDAGSSEVDAVLFARAIVDYLPSRDETMLRYMELLAVFEASSRRMLPEKYRELSNEQLDVALREARIAVAASSTTRR
jgi:SpoVK/Ycf46/Vps4 family AAA+-type ATPase